MAEQLERVMESGLDLSSYSRIYSPMEAYLYLKARIKGGTWRDELGEEHHEKGMPESIQGEEWIRTLTLLENHFLDRKIDGQMYEWLDDESRKLKDGLLSYRGSRFQALIFDTTDGQLKLYDLMYSFGVEMLSSCRLIGLRSGSGRPSKGIMMPR